MPHIILHKKTCDKFWRSCKRRLEEKRFLRCIRFCFAVSNIHEERTEGYGWYCNERAWVNYYELNVWRCIRCTVYCIRVSYTVHRIHHHTFSTDKNSKFRFCQRNPRYGDSQTIRYPPTVIWFGWGTFLSVVEYWKFQLSRLRHNSITSLQYPAGIIHDAPSTCKVH